MKEGRIRDWVDDLQRAGRYGFSATEFAGAVDTSPEARRKALARLQKRDRLRRLRKDFYVILPLEYAKIGMIPVDWFSILCVIWSTAIMWGCTRGRLPSAVAPQRR